MSKRNYTIFVEKDDVDNFCIKTREKHKFLFDIEICKNPSFVNNTRDGEYMKVTKAFKKYLRLPLVIGWILIVPFILLANLCFCIGKSVANTFIDGIMCKIVESIKSIPEFLRKG